MNKSIYQQAEIVKGLTNSFEEVKTFIKETSENKFEASQGDKWSIKEEFEHLILSCKPVSAALKLPKLALRAFGKPRNPSRSFEALVKRYHEKLEGGVNLAVVGSGYAPGKSDQLTKEDMLTSWEMIAGKFVPRIDTWSEEKMDKYLLPHPLLGKLTVREMLFFTIYHNHHHLNSMKVKAG